MKFWPATLLILKTVRRQMLLKIGFVVVCSSFTSYRWIKHSNYKTQPFSEFHNTGSLFSDNQWICRAVNSDYRSEVDCHGQLPSYTEYLFSCHNIMAICRRRAPKNYSFLMKQALITCCWRLVGQNTCNFGEIMDTFFESTQRTRDYVHALMM